MKWTADQVAKAIRGSQKAGMLIKSIEFGDDGSMRVVVGPDAYDWMWLNFAKLKDGRYAFTEDQWAAIRRFLMDQVPTALQQTLDNNSQS